MRHRFIKIAFATFLASVLWLAILGGAIWMFGTNDHVVHSDCIIVLGAAVWGNTPSPVFEERIRHGVNLYLSNRASKLLFTGGFGSGQNYSESRVGAAFARSAGVPDSDILIEENSHTTMQNLTEAYGVMKLYDLNSAIIVSDPLHMNRALMMANDLGMHAVSSPTPTSRYQSFGSRLQFLLREIYFFHHYLITGN